MSIQWMLIATFMYIEIIVVVLLILPILSPKKWQQFFRSRFLQTLGRQASFYFYVLLFVLTLFLLESMREIYKYSRANVAASEGTAPHQLDLEMQVNMRLFRAHRNFYISFFASFLSFVIKRLVAMISSMATLQAQSEAALKQAAGASSAAKDLMSVAGMVSQNKSNEVHDKEVTELKSQMEELKKELENEKRDKKALKEQAAAVNKEYDRLLEEYNKLEKKLVTEPSGDKKGN